MARVLLPVNRVEPRINARAKIETMASSLFEFINFSFSSSELSSLTDRVIGEDTSTPRKFQNQNYSRCLSGEAATGQEKLLGGFRLLTPHAPSGVRTQPAVETTNTRACLLYKAGRPLSTGQPKSFWDNQSSQRR